MKLVLAYHVVEILGGTKKLKALDGPMFKTLNVDMNFHTLAGLSRGRLEPCN